MTSPSGGDQYQQGAGAPGTPHGPKITSIFDFTAESLEQIAFWLEQRGLHIPIAQIVGYQNVKNELVSVVTAESISAAGDVSLTDMATVGPTATITQTRTYTIVYGAHIDGTSGRQGGGDGANLFATVGLNSAGSIISSSQVRTQWYTGTGTIQFSPMNVLGVYSGQINSGTTIKLQYAQNVQLGSGTVTTTFSSRFILIF